MPLATGTRMGPYEILALIGAGGMGEVYRARDTRLRREIAIKVLGSRFHEKADSREHLLQEARAVSALNHPNILSLYDICSENGSEFLVMELVRGKTLDQLIGNRGLAVNEAVKYAIPIADALARAHAAGILHRDLKPSNIMITDDGVPKILDFGLAQAAEAQTSDGDETCSLSGVSQQLVAGTAAYMSPEQAEGKKLDARSDVFSFGSVLYEMVTGRRAFRGNSTALTLAAVLRHDPEPPSLITPQVPRELERIIQRCLRKDPNRRFQTMGDVRVELEEVREESESGIQPAVHAPGRRRSWRYATVALALALAAAAAVWWLHRPQLSPPSAPIPLTAYEGDQLWPDFSPDGNQVVFAWDGGPDGKFHLYVKLVGASSHLQLTTGDGDEMFPAWSPDGRWIAFQRWDHTGSHTMLISPLGGPERTVGDGVCDARLPVVPVPQVAAFHLSWSNDGQWLACSSPDGSIISLAVFGGEQHRLTSPPIGQKDLFPAFSPDGHSLLFEREASLFNCDLFLCSLNRDLSPHGEPRQITYQHARLGGFAWTPDGEDAIWSHVNSHADRVPISHSGHIQLVPFEHLAYPALSRRQNRLAYVRALLDGDIWQADGHTIRRHPLSSTAIDGSPHFSPDGKRIVFTSFRSGPQQIWVSNASPIQAVPLTNFAKVADFPRWSPDGKWIAFHGEPADGRGDIWVIDANGDRLRRLTNDPGGDANAPCFSHDGKWVYFRSIRTGRNEIFRIPFGGGKAIQVTHAGAEYALESSDGKALYYLRAGEAFRLTMADGKETSLGLHVIQNAFEVMADGVYYIAQTHGNRFRGGEIRFYNFATRHERVIQPLGDVLFGFSLSVSPTRKTFLYSAQQGTASDLMLVENFR